MKTQTIAAIATPQGRGGIGIIKVSGPDAIAVTANIFCKTGSTTSSPLQAQPPQKSDIPHKRQILFGHIFDPNGGVIIDEVLLLVMPKPHSYTREDVVEIHTHGGRVALNRVLALLFQNGILPAGPGAFTKRAFINGRIDLTQAEAVMDIINAKSATALKMAARQVSGSMSRKVAEIIRTCRELRVKAEAAVDFPEDVGEIFNAEETVGIVRNQLLDPILSLIQDHEQTRHLRKGVTIAIIGRPNVGKSSLMNCLLKKDRVIVSDTPGTTRDFIEAACHIHSIEVLLTDTAGIHAGRDDVEKMGIDKTLTYLKEADMVLFVTDAARGITSEDLEIYSQISHEKVILVLNKKDLIRDQNNFDLPLALTNCPTAWVSAKYAGGIVVLEKEINRMVVGDGDNAFEETREMPNMRHYHALLRARDAAKSAICAISNGFSPELCAIDMKEVQTAMEEISGTKIQDDVLDAIFNQFCIGK